RGRLARPFRTENNSARGLVPERKAPPKRGAKCTGHQLAEGGVFWPSAAGQFGNSERGDPVPLAASGCCQSVAVEQQVSVPNGDSSANWIVGTRRLRPAPPGGLPGGCAPDPVSKNKKEKTKRDARSPVFSLVLFVRCRSAHSTCGVWATADAFAF